MNDNNSMTNGEKDYRKACTLCGKLRDVLVRCQIDETGQWHFVCPGTCWKRVSGGTVDGDGMEEHKLYRYGGMWKNKHEAVSAKKPKASKKRAQAPFDPAIEGETESGPGDEDECVPRVEPDENNSQSPAENHRGVPAWRADNKKYTKNDSIAYHREVWICRKSHLSVEDGRTPDKAPSLWKQEKGYVEGSD